MVFDRLEPNALTLVQRAKDEAAVRGQKTVGPEHLPLAMPAAWMVYPGIRQCDSAAVGSRRPVEFRISGNE